MIKILTLIKYWTPKFILVFVASTSIWTVSLYSRHIGLFNLETIKVIGNSFVDSTEITDLVNDNLSEPVFDVDLNNIHDIVNNLDFIQTSNVFRVFPSTIVIEVFERTPVALVNDGESLFMVDKNKIILPATGDAINTFPVPVINYTNNTSPDELVNIMNSIRDIYPELYQNLSELNKNNSEYILLSDERTVIYLGENYINNQIYLLKQFINTVEHVKEMNDYSYIDLRIPNQVVVREKGRRRTS